KIPLRVKVSHNLFSFNWTERVGELHPVKAFNLARFYLILQIIRDLKEISANHSVKHPPTTL
ncbi:MAG: hypothetical protein AAF550_13735, partial [Myxococcota bacterium]